MSTTRRTLFCVALLLLASRGEASAQLGGPLTGVESVFLVIEDLSEDGQVCGLDVDSLRNAVAYPVAISRLKISSNPNAPTLYAVVTTVHSKVDDVCASSISLKVFVHQFVQVERAAHSGFHDVVLWEKSGVFLDGKSHHRKQVTSELETMAKELVVEWTDAQPH